MVGWLSGCSAGVVDISSKVGGEDCLLKRLSGKVREWSFHKFGTQQPHRREYYTHRVTPFLYLTVQAPMLYCKLSAQPYNTHVPSRCRKKLPRTCVGNIAQIQQELLMCYLTSRCDIDTINSYHLKKFETAFHKNCKIAKLHCTIWSMVTKV